MTKAENSRDAYGAVAFAKGCVGYLIDVIRIVAAGGYVIGGRSLTARIDRWLDSTEGQPAPGDREPFQPLSSREMEVLAFVTGGMSNKEIATSLGISHQTVKNHVTAILRKLGVEDRTQAAIYALRRGWVRLHEPNSEAQE
jgi:DNA-binding NarL/FixJ family response regulator